MTNKDIEKYFTKLTESVMSKLMSENMAFAAFSGNEFSPIDLKDDTQAVDDMFEGKDKDKEDIKGLTKVNLDNADVYKDKEGGLYIPNEKTKEDMKESEKPENEPVLNKNNKHNLKAWMNVDECGNFKITESRLREALTKMVSKRLMEYDLSDYNVADEWAANDRHPDPSYSKGRYGLFTVLMNTFESHGMDGIDIELDGEYNAFIDFPTEWYADVLNIIETQEDSYIIAEKGRTTGNKHYVYVKIIGLDEATSIGAVGGASGSFAYDAPAFGKNDFMAPALAHGRK